MMSTVKTQPSQKDLIFQLFSRNFCKYEWVYKMAKIYVSFSKHLKEFDIIKTFHILTTIENREKQTINAVDRNLNNI